MTKIQENMIKSEISIFGIQAVEEALTGDTIIEELGENLREIQKKKKGTTKKEIIEFVESEEIREWTKELEKKRKEAIEKENKNKKIWREFKELISKERETLRKWRDEIVKNGTQKKDVAKLGEKWEDIKQKARNIMEKRYNDKSMQRLNVFNL